MASEPEPQPNSKDATEITSANIFCDVLVSWEHRSGHHTTQVTCALTMKEKTCTLQFGASIRVKQGRRSMLPYIYLLIEGDSMVTTRLLRWPAHHCLRLHLQHPPLLIGPRDLDVMAFVTAGSSCERLGKFVQLAQCTDIDVQFEHLAVTKTTLQSLCKGVDQSIFQSSYRQGTLGKLYGGIGGQIIEVVNGAPSSSHNIPANDDAPRKKRRLMPQVHTTTPSISQELSMTSTVDMGEEGRQLTYLLAHYNDMDKQRDGQFRVLYREMQELHDEIDGMYERFDELQELMEFFVAREREGWMARLRRLVRL